MARFFMPGCAAVTSVSNCLNFTRLANSAIYLISIVIGETIMKPSLALIAAILVSTSAALPLQAAAQVSINVNIGSEPPPLRYERVPSPRSGYVWAPGYWDWNGHTHVWADGHWVRERPGYVYERAEWYQENGGWHLRKGKWKAHKGKHHEDRYHCPPGQAKKGNC